MTFLKLILLIFAFSIPFLIFFAGYKLGYKKGLKDRKG